MQTSAGTENGPYRPHDSNLTRRHQHGGRDFFHLLLGFYHSIYEQYKRSLARALINAGGKVGKMADESEDQWLYGDSTDGKEYTSTNIQSEIQQNDSTLSEVQENLQIREDQKMEGTGEIPSEVCMRLNLSQSFRID